MWYIKKNDLKKKNEKEIRKSTRMTINNQMLCGYQLK